MKHLWAITSVVLGSNAIIVWAKTGEWNSLVALGAFVFLALAQIEEIKEQFKASKK